MRYSQVPKLARSSNLASWRWARGKVSCTTSSASDSFPVIRNASRNRARLCRSTSTRNASASPERALSTAACSANSIRLLIRLPGWEAVSKQKHDAALWRARGGEVIGQLGFSLKQDLQDGAAIGRPQMHAL